MPHRVDHLGGLVVKASARRAGDPGSNPGPGENFSLKLLTSYSVGLKHRAVDMSITITLC